MKIKLIKFNNNLKTPTRAHYNDAGLDCYALEDFVIKPEQTSIVNLGFGLEIPDGYMATIRPKSSWNIKNIITQIGTIDSGYRGEIKAAFYNLSKQNRFEVKKGQKICQIIIEPVVLADLVLDLQNDRKDGGFGSSGKE